MFYRKKENKDSRVTFLVTDEQKKIIESMAKERGITLSKMMLLLIDLEYKDKKLMKK